MFTWSNVVKKKSKYFRNEKKKPISLCRPLRQPLCLFMSKKWAYHLRFIHRKHVCRPKSHKMIRWNNTGQTSWRRRALFEPKESIIAATASVPPSFRRAKRAAYRSYIPFSSSRSTFLIVINWLASYSLIWS